MSINKKSGIALLAVFLVFATLSLLIIASICNVKVGLMLYVDGKKVGTVEDSELVDSIKICVLNDISSVIYGTSYVGCDITYRFAEGSEVKDKATEDSIYSAVYIASLKDYRQAYGLFVGGELVAANESSEIIYDAVSAVRTAAQGATGTEVKLNSDLEVRTLYFPKTCLKADNEIVSLLASDEVNPYTAVAAGASSVISADFGIASDEGAYYAPNVENDDGTPVRNDASSDGSALSIETVNKNGTTTLEIITKTTIPFATEYERTPELYIGSYSKKQDGADGVRRTVYKVTYENGVETDRQVVSSSVVKEAVPKIIFEGTKVKPTTASVGIYQWPIEGKYYLTDGYGMRKINGRRAFHYGQDMAISSGTPIYAADGGKVTTATYSSSYGYYVIITHDNGQQTLYAHMRKAAIVEVGERVYQGQKIGEVGSTGFSTGSHLHFEIRINGEKVDPMDYLPH